MSDKFQFIEQLPFSATALFSFLLAWYNRENGVGGGKCGNEKQRVWP